MKNRVLVVDDEPRVRELLKIALEKSNYEVITAESGKEALDILKREKVDLVLADIMMPEMDGYELCKRIREDPKLYPLRFIFVTAKTEREDELEGFKLGADDYITKPFNLKTLLARVERRLKEVREAREEVTKRGEFKGSVSHGNLIDVLQILGMGRKHGILTVRSKEGEGRIALWDGQIVDAKTNRMRAQDAVYEILSWREGEFYFKPGPIKAEGDMALPIPHLLLEWARIKDETSIPSFRDIKFPVSADKTPPIKREWILTYKEWLSHIHSKE